MFQLKLGYSLNQLFALSDADFDKAPLSSINNHQRERILSLIKNMRRGATNR